MSNPIAEHAQVEKDQVTGAHDGYLPSPEEKATVDLVKKLYKKHKKHRQKFDGKWLDFYKMMRGKQWKEERPSYRHSAVINKIFQTIQSQVPMLSDSRPKLEFLPMDPEDRELGEILNMVCESDWESQNWLMILVEVLYDAHMYGTGLGQMSFDSKYAYGQGAACFESASPFYSFPDPECGNVNDKKSKSFIYAEPVDVDRLKAEHPDQAKFIKADLGQFIDAESLDPLAQSTYKSPVNSLATVEGSDSYEDTTKNKALKITAYIKDDTVISELKQSANDDGSIKTEEIKKLKYPKGRRVVISGNVLLEDSELEDDGKRIPFARLQNYAMPREFWGVSEVEQLEGPQVLYNKVFSFVLDVLTLMGNPIWIIDSNSGIDTDNVYNKPGMILEPLPNTRVERKEGVQLQPYVMQLLQVIGKEIQDISGATEVSRGIRPEGVTAAKAIEALQDTAQTRIRQKSRFLDAFLQEIGQLYKSIIFENYTAPRIFRLTNNQNAQNYFKFHVENQQMPTGENQKVAKVRAYVQAPDGSFKADLEAKEYQVRSDFDVRVSTGSSLPFAKQERTQMALNLYDRKLLDPETVLKTVDFPNWESIVEKLKAAEEQAAMAEAGQAPMPEGAPA